MATRQITDWKHRGTLYTNSNATAELTVDATPRKIAALDAVGLQAGLTVDTANNEIVIASAGDYMAVGSISFSGSAGDTFEVAIYKNTSPTGYVLERKIGVGGDVGNSHVNGLITCVAGDKISLYQSTIDGNGMTITNAQLTVVREG
jgi:hypothetical protein